MPSFLDASLGKDIPKFPLGRAFESLNRTGFFRLSPNGSTCVDTHPALPCSASASGNLLHSSRSFTAPPAHMRSRTGLVTLVCLLAGTYYYNCTEILAHCPELERSVSHGHDGSYYLITPKLYCGERFGVSTW